jgi:polar amino acid transport system substrate-binding protein
MYKKIGSLIALFCLWTHTCFADTLVVGTNAEFPPFTYMENNVIVGFDIDVIKEVGKRLNKKIKIKDMPWDALIPELILGNLDVVAAGMSYTEERSKRMLFTKNYLNEDPLVMMTKVDHDVDLNDLNGKTVVVIEGYTADLLMSQKKGVTLIRLPTQADGFMALKSGRADAFVTAKSTVDAFFEKQDATQFKTTPIEGTTETCALVIPKSKPQVLAEVQKALDEMESDGTLDKIRIKWKLQ